MKKQVLILLILFGLFIINSCQKDNNGQNKSSNNNSDTTKKNPPPVVPPIVTITQTPLTILLPNNCTQSFIITNTGPQGSILNYTIADDGALGGFLSFTNGTGSLAAGSGATIMVSVKPAFLNSKVSLVGSSLVLNVYTPLASNYTKIPVPVKIKNISSILPLFIGTWSGTWTGKSYGRNNPTEAQPSSPVSGTWTLTLKTIDTIGLTATGSLTWNGTDAYWTYIVDKNGIITTATPNPFIPNRTIQFDASNATWSYDAVGGSGCIQSQINLIIAGFNNQPNPSDAFYGPWFSAVLDLSSNTAFSSGNGFSTHPYAPVTFDTNFSNGTITGKKQ
ncbi:hypothetical protein [Mucilaginibacter sp. OK098]|uniref:hypothetical protein n=1 Tax=Mucilaginibacter sp. OK098 TaxID=1855297 RepID=UPI00091F8942|nr:hypothetical protein [Mucilaginibacter sp. OK098]SHN18386.1 hypothetical protein SAMN05216524_106200 [Mucilaginibacter sp. OK098]